jgi:hypothetical protein
MGLYGIMVIRASVTNAKKQNKILDIGKVFHAEMSWQ